MDQGPETDVLYALGAFEARGTVSIQRQAAGSDRLIGRISVDTVTASDRLGRFFGCDPIVLRAYTTKNVYRYGSAEGSVVLDCVRRMMGCMPETPRMNELMALQHFHLAGDVEGRVRAMDSLRRVRAGVK